MRYGHGLLYTLGLLGLMLVMLTGCTYVATHALLSPVDAEAYQTNAADRGEANSLIPFATRLHIPHEK